MPGFYLAYIAEVRELAQPVRALDGSTLPAAVAEVPWGHNILLVERLSAPSARLWYARMTTEQGWSRNVLIAPDRGRGPPPPGRRVGEHDCCRRHSDGPLAAL